MSTGNEATTAQDFASSADVAASEEAPALFLDVWQPKKESRMFLLSPAVLIGIAALLAYFGKLPLAAFLVLLAVGYCVFSVIYKKDKRLNRYLWLTGDAYYNRKVRCLNDFVRGLKSVGAVDEETEYDDVDYWLEELTDEKAVFQFSTTQAGKPMDLLENPLARISPVFRAYTTRFELVDAVTCRITYILANPDERLGRTYRYRPGDSGYE